MNIINKIDLLISNQVKITNEITQLKLSGLNTDKLYLLSSIINEEIVNNINSKEDPDRCFAQYSAISSSIHTNLFYRATKLYSKYSIDTSSKILLRLNRLVSKFIYS